MNDTLDQTAQQIADGGHQALVARLRPAFERAAAAHSDLIQIPPERLEQMIEDAVERADGLQWRRALAGVAVDQLGIELGEALRHPAVARAQEILGVPSYESALGTSTGSAPATPPAAARSTPPRAPKAPPPVEAPPTPEPPPAPEPPTAVIPANEPEAPVAPQPEPAEAEPWRAQAGPPPEAPTESYADADATDTAQSPDAVEEEVSETATARGPSHEPVPAAPPEAEEPEELEELEEAEEPAEPLEPGDVSVPAVHLGGIANLAPGEEGLELRFAEPGLDIARENDAILGRIAWREIRSVEVGAPGRLRRRRKDPEAKLVIRTERGDASFRIPGAEEDDLRRQLAPALLRVPPQE